MNPAELASYFDHTLLKPDAVRADFERLADECVEHGFAAACVPNCWVALTAARLSGAPARAATVAGFPHGNETPLVKADQTRRVVDLGADEIDMVLNIGALKGGDDHAVLDDIAAVVDAAGGRPVKVILECCLLTDAQKRLACTLAHGAGAAYVKTSTGFNGPGATVEDVRLMRETLDAAGAENVQVKAAGGVRTAEQARAMIDAGATRIGCSSSVAIVRGETGSASY